MRWDRDHGASARLSHPCCVVVLWCERSALIRSVIWWLEPSARKTCGVLVATLVPRLLLMRFTSLIGRFCSHCQKEGGWVVGVVVGVGCYGCDGGGAGCRFLFGVANAAPHQFHVSIHVSLLTLSTVFAA